MSNAFNAGTRMYYTRPSDGAAYCFEPVPLLAESKEYSRTVDSRLATIHTLTFNGTLLPGLPALSGVDPNASCLQLLDRKSDQMGSVLSEDYGDLLIVDSSGYPVIVAKPRVLSLSFDESQIVNHRKYNLVFEFESEFSDDAKVKEYSENWSFNQNEDDTVAVSHQINAVGITEPGIATAIENAQTYVLTKIGLDKTKAVAIQVPNVQALVSVDELLAYNHVLSEASNETDGSYDLTETWTLASGGFKDDRTVDHSFELNGDNILVETVNINGTVLGYGDTTIDRYASAVDGFNNTVIDEIDFNATSGIFSKSRGDNRFAGTVTYSIVRSPSGDNIEARSISRSLDRQDDGSVVQSVTTSATVRKGSASSIDVASDYCFANNYPIDSAIPQFSAALSGNLQSVSIQRDDVVKSFSLTRIFVDQSTELWAETWELSRQQQVDTSETQITIQGEVRGLGVETSTKSFVRFASASGAYYGIVEPAIPSRVASIIPTGSCIDSNSTSTSFGYNKFTGVISYSRTFSNRFLTSNPNITKEEVDVTFHLAADVVSTIPVPGKLSGPILQDQETKTGLSKTLAINYTVSATGNCVGNVVNSNAQMAIGLAESDILVNNTYLTNSRGEKPVSSATFKTADTYSFNRQSNVFTRNTTWLYL